MTLKSGWFRPPAVAAVASPAVYKASGGSGLRAVEWCEVKGWAQSVAAMLLAVYPWLRVFGWAGPPDQGLLGWRIWLAAIGLHAVWLYLRPATRPATRYALGVAALCLILGLIVIRVLVLNHDITAGNLLSDYTAIASWIHTASKDPTVSAQNVQRIWWLAVYAPGSYFHSAGVSPPYLTSNFDLILPLLDRLFYLTSSPFKLMGYWIAAILSGSLVIWLLCARHPRLQSFQILLPVAMLFHPAVAFTLHTEFRNAGLPLSLLMLGSYFFFQKLRLRAFFLLLAGTVTKIVYWPSWLMFGVLHATRREWRWAALYLGCGAVALSIHRSLQPMGISQPELGFFGGLGSSLPEILFNLMFSPSMWIGRALDPVRWMFLAFILLPWAFPIPSYWKALLPVVPLAVFSLLETLGTRSLIFFPYTLEYLAFVLAATLVALRSAGRFSAILTSVAITVGTIYLFPVPALPIFEGDTGDLWGEIAWASTERTKVYFDEVAFSSCALSDQPFLTTVTSYPSYVRGDITRLWMDLGLLLKATDQERLPEFDTLISPASIDVIRNESLPHLIVLTDPADIAAVRAYHQSIRDRLPVKVTTALWEYRGGSRLAACAEQFGYPIEGTSSGPIPAR